MTRFLSRMWDDPECGALNKDTERLFAYHQATKHTYHSVRANARLSRLAAISPIHSALMKASPPSFFRLSLASRTLEHLPPWQRSRRKQNCLPEMRLNAAKQFHWT